MAINSSENRVERNIMFCTKAEDYYYITKTSEGIKIEEKDYDALSYFITSR